MLEVLVRGQTSSMLTRARHWYQNPDSLIRCHLDNAPLEGYTLCLREVEQHMRTTSWLHGQESSDMQPFETGLWSSSDFSPCGKSYSLHSTLKSHRWDCSVQCLSWPVILLPLQTHWNPLRNFIMCSKYLLDFGNMKQVEWIRIAIKIIKNFIDLVI